jgi:hypothetical protein
MAYNAMYAILLPLLRPTMPLMHTLLGYGIILQSGGLRQVVCRLVRTCME